MTIGQKIKKFRTEQNLSQKQLAIRVGISEPAIRNYELGNRTPSKRQIKRIAKALNISPYALSNPELDTDDGLMHSLFYLEDNYDLKIVDVNDEPHLKFSNASSERLLCGLSEWLCEYKKLLNNKISKQEYDEWRYTYPQESK